MKLLVTGGAGFIGSNFIHYWLNKYPSDKIVNLDALTYAGNVDNLKNLPNRQNYEFVLGNICDAQIVDEVMKETELVVHFAAESHVDNSIIDSTPFVKTNVLGTQVLLDAALKNGKKRFHHISTDEVFGSLGPNDPPFNENTPYDPRSPYSASKAGADHLVRAYWHTHQLPITISNCSNNYGPRQHKEKLIPLFITNLLQNKPVPVYGTGQNIRDWLYVDDHCSAIDAIISRGKIGETYLIGGKGNKEEEITNLKLTKKLISLLDKDESLIEYAEDRKGHDFRYAIDDAKLRTELGWQPEVDFEEGLKKTIEWYKNSIK
ncbi:dTDP-glucose 4,6-dehydratase [Candidatus Falkowbacteria bacterium CG10_big_fil_rev_8_21_14_0_10_43_11]|uniref:dTDP-glucose 4,6-dehydratase n=1 Tax=Candidatus Falkowbacteria bacterium CG10_big_fil_rev_8_21_14_0_10_43_11 TaxID=1974568 RepID=A0A2M6WLF7_9BACT|nr:MAG: dTDP-glucose 4,6-dehydratase [Candidatus Falkowbacteria bacterium CG10_big_fil_rev_8_21_14_0_10_43_11]